LGGIGPKTHSSSGAIRSIGGGKSESIFKEKKAGEVAGGREKKRWTRVK